MQHSNRRAIVIVAVLCVSLAGAAWAGNKPEKIRWMPLSHQQFSVSAEVGMFLSCAYRLFKPGASGTFEYAHKEKLKLLTTKTKDEKLTVQLYVNKAQRKLIDRAAVLDMLESAITECYERLSDEE